MNFHHSWSGWEDKARQPFAQIKDHVLFAKATELVEVDRDFRAVLTPDRIRRIVSLIPDEWLSASSKFESPEQQREAYIQFLEKRLDFLKDHVKEIHNGK